MRKTLKEVVQINSFRLCKSALEKPGGSERGKKGIPRQKPPNRQTSKQNQKYLKPSHDT